MSPSRFERRKEAIVIKQLYRSAKQPENRNPRRQKSPQTMPACQFGCKTKRQRREQKQYSNNVNGMHDENLPDDRRDKFQIFLVFQFPRKKKICGSDGDLYQTS